MRGASYLIFLCAIVIIASLRQATALPEATAQPGPATGPLRVLESNPRYFMDGSGKAIYLAGSHQWHNFQDNGHRLPQGKDPPEAFDYDGYLDFLQKHHHNFFR